MEFPKVDNAHPLEVIEEVQVGTPHKCVSITKIRHSTDASVCVKEFHLTGYFKNKT